jgi:hypothetical protein
MTSRLATTCVITLFLIGVGSPSVTAQDEQAIASLRDIRAAWETEIPYLDLSLRRDKDVGRFDVTMDDSLRMSGIERVAHPPLEVVGALNSPVDPVHTFQKPEVGPALFVGVFAFGFYWNFTRHVSLANFHERGTNRDAGILVRTDI